MNEIFSAIEGANTFLFVISPDSANSEVCAREAEFAASLNKRIVPLVHREVPGKKTPSSISSHNWIFMRSKDDFQRSFRDLMRALDTDLEHCRIHTRLLVRAREWESKGANRSFLLRGVDLKEAEVWLERSSGKDPAPTDLQRQFIYEGRKQEDRKSRLLLGSVTTGLIVALSLAGLATFMWLEALRQKDLALRREKEADRQKGIALEQEAIAKERTAFAEEQKEIAENREAEASEQRVIAERNEQEALRQKSLAERRRIRVQSGLLIEQAAGLDDPELALLLSIEAMSRLRSQAGERSPEVESALRARLERVTGEPLERPSAAAGEAMFLADGTHLIAWSRFGPLELWNLQTGKKTIQPEFSRIRLMAISRLRNVVLVQNMEGELILLQEGQIRRVPYEPSGSVITALAIAPNGSSIALGLSSGEVRIGTVDGSFQVAGSGRQHKGHVLAMQFLDSHQFVSVGLDGKAVLHAAGEKGQPLKSNVILEHDTALKEIQVSPGAGWMAIRDEEGRVFILTQDASLAVPPMASLYAEFYAFAGEAYLAYTDRGNRLQLMDLSRPARVLLLGQHEASITSLSVSASGQITVSGDERGTVKVWDNSRPGRLLDSLRSQASPVRALDTRNYMLASFQQEGLPRVHRLNASMGSGTPGRIRSFLHRGDRLICLTEGRNLEIFSLGPAGELARVQQLDEKLRLYSASRDGSWVAGVDLKGRIWLLSYKGVKMMLDVAPDPEMRLLSVSGVGPRITTLSADGILQVREIGKQGQILSLMETPSEDLVDIGMDPQGQKLYGRKRNHEVRVWDLSAPGRAPLPLPSLPGGVETRLSSNGRAIFTVGNTPSFLVWDLQNPSLKPLAFKTRKDQSGLLVLSADFSPSHGRAHILQKRSLFRVDGRTGKELPFRDREGQFVVSAMAPSGAWIVTGDSRGRVLAYGPASDSPIHLGTMPGRIAELDVTVQGLVLTLDDSGYYKSFSLRLDHLLHMACHKAGRNLTKEEWFSYLPGEPYSPVCLRDSMHSFSLSPPANHIQRD